MEKQTKSFSTDEVKREWLLVDLDGVPLGRAASRIADIIRGKHKPQYTPHADVGDFVVVINASKVLLTGNKRSDKIYYHHTGYIGNLKERNVAHYLEANPAFIIRHAVKGMLPKNRLSRQLLRKIKVYPGAEHPHSAQQPKAINIMKKMEDAV